MWISLNHVSKTWSPFNSTYQSHVHREKTPDPVLKSSSAGRGEEHAFAASSIRTLLQKRLWVRRVSHWQGGGSACGRPFSKPPETPCRLPIHGRVDLVRCRGSNLRPHIYSSYRSTTVDLSPPTTVFYLWWLFWGKKRCEEVIDPPS